MSKVLISGLVNTETTVRVRQFPLEYYPIDYPFFGIDTAVSGVAYNIALAMSGLGDSVRVHSMTGDDYSASYIRHELEKAGIAADAILPKLRQTPSSVVLYDETGRRQIHCDLKDIQDTAYGFTPDVCRDVDIVVACNINFNRELLAAAKAAGKCIATDVHVLSNVWDDYNRDFLAAADILFLSDEGVGTDYGGFMMDLERVYHTPVIVLGRGSKGAAMYVRDEDRFYDLPAVSVGPVVNTVGAGDALFSAFVHYYAKGLPYRDALMRAQVFASAKIGVSGASRGFCTEADVEYLLNQHGWQFG